MIWREAATRRYIGHSADGFPRLGGEILDVTDGSRSEILQSHLLVGSSFLQVDTGRLFHYDGFDWICAPADDLAILTELKGISETLTGILEAMTNLSLGLAKTGLINTL